MRCSTCFKSQLVFRDNTRNDNGSATRKIYYRGRCSEALVFVSTFQLQKRLSLFDEKRTVDRGCTMCTRRSRSKYFVIPRRYQFEVEALDTTETPGHPLYTALKTYALHQPIVVVVMLLNNGPLLAFSGIFPPPILSDLLYQVESYSTCPRNLTPSRTSTPSPPIAS